MIESGRTASVKEQLEKWYSSEQVNAEAEWKWGFNKEAIQELLDTRKLVPFRCFLVRYILAVHKDEMQPFLSCGSDEAECLGKSADEILRLMDESEESGYAEAPEALKKLTDLVFDDFISNQFCMNDDKTGELKIRGCVNRGLPTKGQKTMRPILWDKNDLLKKLKARKLATDFSNKPEYINEDEVFAFAFGLNMDYDDISFLMQKALRRSGFNMWNWKEFLLYMTYKFAKGNIFEFYLKLKESYEDETNAAKAYQWGQTQKDFSTMAIQNQTDMIAQMIQEEQYAVALNEDGELPEKMVEYIREYKYLMENSKDYTRTIVNESYELLQDFKDNIGDAVREAGDVALYGEWRGNTQENEKHAQGKVIIYYDPEEGLNIPKGTVFTKVDKKWKRKIEFVSKNEVKIAPVISAKVDVEIPVVCSEKTKKMSDPKEQTGYMPGKTKFTSDSPYLSDITNKSTFKTPTKAAVGSQTYVSGKVFAKCEAGKEIKEGTKFYAKNEKGENVVFLSEKAVDAAVFAEVWVVCSVQGETATKNQITECSIPDWKKKFRKLENSMIGFIQKENAQTGGLLYNYLYQPNKTDHRRMEMELDESYLEKLADVLEGTQLSSTKLNQIEKKKAEHITRNDILTLNFLTYMSCVEYERAQYEEKASKDYKTRYEDFMLKTNESLRKCGYYELYAPNPYDSLLFCLVSSNEAVDAYRNLWSWYLSYKESKESRKEGK